MESGNGPRPEPGRLQWRGVLDPAGAGRVADQARRVHQDVEAPMVRSQTRKAPLVQGLERDPSLGSSRRHHHGDLPDRQGRRGHRP